MLQEEEIKRILAPWSDELVNRLNDYQRCGGGHPYTCGTCRDKYHTRFIVKNGKLVYAPNEYGEHVVIMDRELVATQHGWVCHTCDNIQDWCFDPNS